AAIPKRIQQMKTRSARPQTADRRLRRPGTRPRPQTGRRRLRTAGRPRRRSTVTYKGHRQPRAATGASSWLWKLAAALLAAGALSAVVVQSVGAHGQKSCLGAGDQIIWAAQVTQEEGNSPQPPTGLLGRAYQLAACGGGQLVSIRGAGQGGVLAAPVMSLRIYRDAGEVEHDATARDKKTRQLVVRAGLLAQATRV